MPEYVNPSWVTLDKLNKYDGSVGLSWVSDKDPALQDVMPLITELNAWIVW